MEFIRRRHAKPWSLFFAHKAVHPDAEQAADGTFAMEGYRAAPSAQGPLSRLRLPEDAEHAHAGGDREDKPAWAEAFELRKTDKARAILAATRAGSRRRSACARAMMAAVDEGVGMLFEALERTGQLDDTMILFLGDNGYFFGEHGLGPDRRFAYEEGIRSPLVVRYPTKVKAGPGRKELVILQDIAPTLIELAGGRPGPQVQGRSLLPCPRGQGEGWRKSFLIEYWAENAMPWLVGMTYKAVRTDRHKYIQWVNRARDGELDELYDLESDPYEIANVIRDPTTATRDRLRRELRGLVAAALGL